MKRLLIETDQDIDPVDDSSLFYAKPINKYEVIDALKDYILRYRFHSGLDYSQEIGEQTAIKVAGGIYNILLNPIKVKDNK